jgi:nitrogen regulatory protein PII
MKKLEAIIVPGKLDAVRAELERLGMHATLTLTDVQQADEQKASILPDTETPRLLNDRLKVELIVGDRQAQKAVEVLTQYGPVALLRVNETLQISSALGCLASPGWARRRCGKQHRKDREHALDILGKTSQRTKGKLQHSPSSGPP